MKIFSDILVSPENILTFVLYLDTQKTGNSQKDVTHCAGDMTSILDMNDPGLIMELITPLLSELIYNAYGIPPLVGNIQPLTDINTTGFNKDAY